MLAAALLASVLVATPAFAFTTPPTAQVASGSGVIYATGCYIHQVDYAVQLPSGTRDWTLDIKLFGPDGTPVDSNSLYSFPSSPEPTSGSDGFQLCSFELPGTYTITATIKVCDFDLNCLTNVVPRAMFVMRQPFSTTALSASNKPRSGKSLARFKITSADERPNGYFTTSYADVYLEQRVGRGWKRVRGTSTTTGDDGSVVIKSDKLKPKNNRGTRVSVRAVTASSTEIAGSISDPVTILVKRA